MIEREPPKVWLKIHHERDYHEARLLEFDQTLNDEGDPVCSYTAFEMRHKGIRYFFDSGQVDVEDILTDLWAEGDRIFIFTLTRGVDKPPRG